MAPANHAVRDVPRADLRGRGPLPGLVGRSPSYLVRQLQDMQPGTRKRIWTDPMRAVADELTDEEMIAIGADLASSKRWPHVHPGLALPPPPSCDALVNVNS
ncbi:MAG: hypothetical protein KGM92_15780 [Acidobacteriota bacterium]|nr:hypothetical protein [Acidobacteriota bacterium]